MKNVIWFIAYVLALTLATVGIIAFISWGFHLLSWTLVRWTIVGWATLLLIGLISTWVEQETKGEK